MKKHQMKFLLRHGSSEHMDEFISSKDPYTRENIARTSEKLNKEQLDRLVNDPVEDVRWAAAGNKNSTKEQKNAASNMSREAK